MKSILTFSILYLFSGAALSAQPTLTATTSMPAPGFSDKVYNSFQFLPGTAGTNQTWDVSTQTFGTSAAASYQPCNTTNGCSMYPGATMAYGYSGTFIYYKAGAAVLAMQGFWNGGTNNLFTDPEDYLRFPFTYGNSFVDSFASSYRATGAPDYYYRKGIDSVTADGWGTLKTPAGTYTNTLRIKTISTYKDSGIIMGLSDFIKYKSYTYNWFDVAHKDFLFTTANIIVTPKTGAASTINYARYTSNQSVGIASPAITAVRWQVSPNPAKGKVQVFVSLDAVTLVSLSLTDITGRVVRSLPPVSLYAGENRVCLPIEGLPAGVYILHIMAGNEIMTTKAVIE